MEKLTQPYLRRSLALIEESEPWLMSGLKLSSFLPANHIPLPWSRSFIGGTSFKEHTLVKNRVWVHLKYILSSHRLPLLPPCPMLFEWSLLEGRANSSTPSPETLALVFCRQLFLQETFRSPVPLAQKVTLL